jgi:O-antigen/teichoic acid export membrane protein
MLGLELFGQYALVQTTLLTVAFVAQVATGTTATKYVAEYRSSDPGRAGRIAGLCALVTLATSAICFLIIALSAGWVASVAMKAPGLAFAVRLGAAFVIFNCLNFYQIGFLAGLESYPAIALTSLAGGLGTLCLTVPLTWFFGLNGAVTALALGSALRWGICYYVLHKELRRHGLRIIYGGAWEERSILWKFSIPAALSGFFTMPATWLATLFLVKQPNGFAENALYSAALNLKTAVTFLASNVNNVGVSMLNNQKGLNAQGRYRRLYFTNIVICTVLVLAVGSMVLLAGPFLLALYGRQFQGGWLALQILILAAVVETLSLAVYQIIQSHERMWSSLVLIAFPASAALPLLAYWLTPLHGAVGLAIAVLGSALVHLLMTCVVAFPVAKQFLFENPLSTRQVDPAQLQA